MIFKLYFIVVATALFTFVRSTPVNWEAQACKELCTNCRGTATFNDGKCECDIEENGKEGAECLRRTRREVGDNGFKLISCDLLDDDRKTRCTLGSKHYQTKNSIDQVAKYFMKDGPITGSIFKAPPYSVRSKLHNCGERAQIVGQPMEPLQRVSYAKAPAYVPPQQVIINLPQGYVPSDSPIIGSGSSDAMTGNTRLILQPKIVPDTSAENLGSLPVITQPKKVMPDPTVGGSHIITQPKEFLPVSAEIEPDEPDKPVKPEIKLVQKIEPDDEDVVVSLDEPKAKTPCDMTGSPLISGDDYGALNMVAFPKTATPLFMQSLLQQLSQPMLGIPQAFQTITKAPGINQIVSAPGNLLNSLVSRLSTKSDSGSKSKGDSGGGDDGSGDFQFTTNSQLLSHYNPDLFKLYVNPGDDFNPVVGSENPYSTIPATHILIHPVSSYTATPIVQSPMIGGYSPYDRDYIPQAPTYMVGSPMTSTYFDPDESYVPVYYNAPKIEHVVTKPKVKVQIPKENAPSTKEIIVGVPIAKSKKICKKATEDESFKKVARDTKTFAENFNQEVVDTNEKNQDYVGITQAAESLKIDRTTRQEPIIEETPNEERKHSIIKTKTERAKTEISSKIKKSKGEKKSDVNKK